MIDPIVEEVRRHRMEHTRKFGGNLRRICEDLRRIEQESGCEVVSRPPKLLAPKQETKKETPGSSEACRNADCSCSAQKTVVLPFSLLAASSAERRELPCPH